MQLYDMRQALEFLKAERDNAIEVGDREETDSLNWQIGDMERRIHNEMAMQSWPMGEETE